MCLPIREMGILIRNYCKDGNMVFLCSILITDGTAKISVVLPLIDRSTSSHVKKEQRNRQQPTAPLLLMERPKLPLSYRKLIEVLHLKQTKSRENCSSNLERTHKYEGISK